MTHSIQPQSALRIGGLPFAMLACVIFVWPTSGLSVVTLVVDNAALRLDKRELSMVELTAELQQQLEQRGDLGVVVSAAEDLPKQRLLDVMQALKQAGITKTTLSQP